MPYATSHTRLLMNGAYQVVNCSSLSLQDHGQDLDVDKTTHTNEEEEETGI